MRKIRRLSILTVILIFVILFLCAPNVLAVLYEYDVGVTPNAGRVLFAVAVLIVGLAIWAEISYLVYIIATRGDRIKERIFFSLSILNYGLRNNLEEKEIAKALCEERGGKRETIFARVAGKLSEGATLIEALSADKGIFPRNICSILSAGEKIGNLPQLISYCQESLKLDRSVSTRVAMQFVYPVLILVPVFGVSLFLFYFDGFTQDFFLIPEEPGSVMAQTGPPWLFYPIIIVMIAIWLIVRRSFFRGVNKKKDSLNYLQVLTSALDLNIEEKVALELSAQSCNDVRMRKSGGKVKELLEDGYSLDEAIATSFPHGEEMSWFFRQSREADASQSFHVWQGILRDKIDRQADIFSQGLSVLLILSVGVGICIIATYYFSILTGYAYSLMW